MIDLALKLGKTIAEIERMESRELSEWIAYFQLLTDEQTKSAMDHKAAQLQSKAKSALKA
jgi:hypothetical protein